MSRRNRQAGRSRSPVAPQKSAIHVQERPELGRGVVNSYTWADGSLVVSPSLTGSPRPEAWSLQSALSYFLSLLTSTFMPIGFPDTVAPEYFTFQVLRITG